MTRHAAQLAGVVLLVVAGAACVQPQGNTPSTGVKEGNMGMGGAAGSGAGGTPGRDGESAATDAPPADPVCARGTHACNGACARDDDPATCGTSCQPCPTAEGGTATCDGSKCGVTCPAGQDVCADRCIPTTMACVDQCRADQNLCGKLCVSASSVSACGPTCLACPTSPSGDTSCDGQRCSLTCKPGFHLCTDRCLPADRPDSCGDRCAPCPPPPPGGVAACTAGQCDFTCPRGQKCGDKCIGTGESCGPKKESGASCGGNGDCSSGACVEGICCENACEGKCRACTRARNGTADGKCLPVPKGDDPDNECAQTDARSCGETGACDGKGACEQYGKETQCAAETCSGDSHAPVSLCNGAGACMRAAGVKCPGNLLCGPNGQCLTACTGNQDCAGGLMCQAGQCRKLAAAGDSCSGNGDCLSNVCGKGRCCKGACAAQPPCGNTGACDASGECAKAGTDVMCAGESCTANTQFPARSCNGQGQCPPQGSGSPCPNSLKCGGNQCLTRCSTDGDCAGGQICQNGTCQQAASNGQGCQSDGQCSSKHCVRGICCKTTCAAGGGVCGNSGACQADGNSCQKGASGTKCSDAGCSSDRTQEVSEGRCDGNGACKGASMKSCNGRLCAGDRCQTCSSPDVNCQSGRSCDPGGQSCSALKGAGSQCTDTAQCQSNLVCDTDLALGGKSGCCPRNCIQFGLSCDKGKCVLAEGDPCGPSGNGMFNCSTTAKLRCVGSGHCQPDLVVACTSDNEATACPGSSCSFEDHVCTK
jgi:hypothetical protein